MKIRIGKTAATFRYRC